MALKRSSFKSEESSSQRRMMKQPGGLTDVSSHGKLARMFETPQGNDDYKSMDIYS